MKKILHALLSLRPIFLIVFVIPLILVKCTCGGVGSAPRDPLDPPPTTQTPNTSPPTDDIAVEPPYGTVPVFPWPPPKPSAKVEVFPNAFAYYPTLGDLNLELSRILYEKGYVDRSYFLVPGIRGHGFALATQMEQIDKNAFSKAPPNRWNVHPVDNHFTFSDYVSSLFFSNPGYFRVMVFVVTDMGFSSSNLEVDRETAMEWLDIGYSELPPFLEQLPLSADHKVTALIYEYKVVENSEVAELVKPSRHSGKNHLEKAELW